VITLDYDSLLPWGTFLWMLGVSILGIGLWRGRREAAEKASGVAVTHIRELFDQRFAELDRREATNDLRRAAEYQRLHTKANEMQSAINENFSRLADMFTTRPEFDRLDRQVHTLETRVNLHLDNRHNLTEKET